MYHHSAPVLLRRLTGELRENHWPTRSNWETLLYIKFIAYTSPRPGIERSTSVLIDIFSFKQTINLSYTRSETIQLWPTACLPMPYINMEIHPLCCCLMSTQGQTHSCIYSKKQVYSLVPNSIHLLSGYEENRKFTPSPRDTMCRREVEVYSRCRRHNTLAIVSTTSK